MKRLNLPLITDTAFAALCGFILAFSALRFYTRITWLSLMLGVLAAIVCGLGAYLFIRSKKDKSFILTHTETERKMLAMHMALLPKKQVLVMLKQAMGERLKNEGKQAYVDDRKVYFKYTVHPLTIDDITSFLHSKNKKIYLFGNTLSLETKALLEYYEIPFISSDELYGLLKEKEALPKEFLWEPLKRQRFWQVVKRSFNKKLSLPLLRAGFILLITAYLTYYPVYYLIAGSVLLVLSLAAKLSDQFKEM